MSYPSKRRRTATSVLAGNFDPRPQRDVLTSLLNGVPMPKHTPEELQARKERKRERRERHEREKERAERGERDRVERDKKRVKTTHRSTDIPPPLQPPSLADKSKGAPQPALHRPQPSPFWQARPQIVIPNLQRSASFSPPPMPSSAPTTPGPSVSSRTSAASSKRPYTPDDLDDLTDRQQSVESQTAPPIKKERKKRIAARKGWKGWVEGSPPPSEKLINLDQVTVLAERKTRSGKSFDAIGAGRDGWV